MLSTVQALYRRRNQSRKAKKKARQQQPKGFFASPEWQALRYQVLRTYGAQCQCCGATRKTGAIIQVDHIKSRARYPKLALEFSNLQVLCKACNEGKGWQDSTDWR